MKYKYQKINLQLAEKNTTDKITVLTNADEAQDFSKKLQEKIGKAFEDKKNTVFIEVTDANNFILCISKTENEPLRKLGAEVYAKLLAEKTNEVALSEVSSLTEKQVYHLLEGLILSSYNFDKYKGDKSEEVISVFVNEKNISKEKLEELQIISEATSLTKSMVNEPLNFMNALKFAEVAEEVSKIYGFENETLHKKQIETLKMGALLGVNKGSATPPTFNIFTYKPENAKNEKPLVLVGKGVMFDTGGYSLKTGGFMLNMKSDMAGGAAVLGAVAAIAGNKLPYYVIGLVPATDNMISSEGMVVDDVITGVDGTTIEVQNTDAEGRLVLSDALAYAKKYNPELVIDIATLTGASRAITANFGVAMMGNDKNTMEKLENVGEEVYERVIELPFWDEFGELLKSEIADIRNMGGRLGGATTAGKFLEHFTDYPWVHLDIAGAAYIESKKDYRQFGATATPVRLIYEFVKGLYN